MKKPEAYQHGWNSYELVTKLGESLWLTRDEVLAIAAMVKELELTEEDEDTRECA